MRLIERAWYAPRHPLALLLSPLSCLFGWLAARRRSAYARGARTVTRLPVSVIVVGNLTVGGTGKTPLTAALAAGLRAAGYTPGIVSRGYGGQADTPLAVSPDSHPAQVGDEPLLLARSTRAPVWVCRQRAAAAQALLAAHPEVDIILCDDGLQHYALGRDIELCVIDGQRGFGNGRLLPAGPLREPVDRLQSVDAVVVNGEGDMPAHPHGFRMQLVPGVPYRLDNATITRSVAALPGPLTAVCGIGNPQRFFATLRGLGLQFAGHDFPDHHAFTVADLPAGTLIVTEKDAVKLAAMPDLGDAGARIWVLPVTAVIQPDLIAWLSEKLKHGRQTA
ncbi:lipid-A-disaccharide kinase [Andreprevotia lacus DSM 23236]|jgi:tetraacyldisaccharide 4'-kinase|uniref:Tetraacyldisaccharide 4'-kinase n=1 Tax=Andreprevotia lacus DSM 23236 TaxID=1121001 RepID=A0A1W1XLI1_9NEIS|nr:tetraacyldisaccharide 4'-kinase [Andreprevotia lacus]SMC24368.1 lipid-A-disaccharide kinase [Andreprevotia lacus DSM 23236]